MELVFRIGNKKKKVEVSESIFTIQGPSEIIDKLNNDYDVSIIDNRNLFFVGDDLLTEIFFFNDMPDIEFVNEIMKIMGQNSDFLNKSIDILSTTEKILVNLYRNLSFNKKIIIFKNIFDGIDLNYHKSIIKVLKYLVSTEHIVFLLSDDVNMLYKYGDYSLIANKNSIKYGLTDEIYKDVDSLLKLKLDIPTLSYITYKAKKDKNIKLFYSKDVRDLIKDVYKHV